MKCSILLIAFFLSSVLKATEITPIQIAFFEPLQLSSKDTTVIGFRFNLFYGLNKNVYGLDTGLVNIVDEDSVGVSAGLVNGSQNHIGLQTGVFNYAKRSHGFQVGIANYSENPFLQIGAINAVSKPAYLPMFGILVNWAEEPYLGQYSIGFNQAREAPLQLAGVLNNNGDGFFQFAGAFNYTGSGKLQLAGLANTSDSYTTAQVSPGINRSNSSFFQTAGLFNFADKSPIQIALLGNKTNDGIIQLSLFGNFTKKSTTQFAGFGNYTENSSIQLSGILNVNSCTKECAGYQVALLSNYGSLSQLQLGLFNKSIKTNIQIGGFNLSEESETSQVGIFNRSIKTKGSMIGLINESHELYGYQIGLFNVAKNAEYPFTLFFNSNYDKRTIRNSTGFVKKGWSPIQISLYAPAQIFTNETPIRGLRTSLFYGKNISVYGIDFGLFNRSSDVRGIEFGVINQIEGIFYGLQTGIFNSIEEPFSGVQIGLAQYNRKSLYGFSIAPFAVTFGDVMGMQMGLLTNYGNNILLPQFSLGVNIANSAPVQISGIGNYSATNMKFPQISGGFNYVKGNAYGQIGGLFNIAEGDVLPGQVSIFFNQSKFTPFQLAAIGNHAINESYLQVAGIFNMVTREMRSAPLGRGDDPYAQISLFFNLSRKTYLQVSAFNIDNGKNFAQAGAINFADAGHFQAGGININLNMEGAQVGFVNGATGAGFQIGAVNLSSRYQGVSVGVWNMSDSYKGVSVGLFNFANRLKGFQLGLINIHMKGSVPIMLGVNTGGQE